LGIFFNRLGSAGLQAGLLAALLLVMSPGVRAADVTAEVDRDRVVEGETITLVFQTDDPQQSLETDLGALAPAFEVIDQRSETQMSIVNGRQSARVRSLITLEPLQTGRLTIPSFSFRGGGRTAPIPLTVEPAPTLAPGELPPVFIEVEVDPQEGPYYVHAQLSLKVRIFYQQNMTEAAINPPEPSEGSVRLLDELPYQADRNGERYRVLERRYAVFPERSGTLTIPPLQLTGKLIERAADRLWQPSVSGRRIRVESDPLTLDISPRPPEFTGDVWLPAREIQLSQQITDGESVTVGEPVTRTIILDARGLEEHMLEEPAWPDLENARLYPDQPQGITRDDGEWVLGHREYRYAVVPETPGELVLPAISLTWWDTVNHRQRVAMLPEHRVTVLPSALGVQAPPAPGTEQPSADGSAGAAQDGGTRLWQAISAGLFVLWVITLGALLRRGHAPGRDKRPGDPGDERGGRTLAVLRKACEVNDARAAHAALTRWVRHHGPAEAGGSLMALARRADAPDLDAAIRSLDASAYGGTQASDWQGRAFWQVFSEWRKAGSPMRNAASLPEGELDLYATAR
jgi:hypothetical protein